MTSSYCQITMGTWIRLLRNKNISKGRQELSPVLTGIKPRANR